MTAASPGKPMDDPELVEEIALLGAVVVLANDNEHQVPPDELDSALGLEDAPPRSARAPHSDSARATHSDSTRRAATSS